MREIYYKSTNVFPKTIKKNEQLMLNFIPVWLIVE